MSEGGKEREREGGKEKTCRRGLYTPLLSEEREREGGGKREGVSEGAKASERGSSLRKPTSTPYLCVCVKTQPVSLHVRLNKHESERFDKWVFSNLLVMFPSTPWC